MPPTRMICFPFDLFGSPGTSQGATLLTDAVRELLADNRRDEKTGPARTSAYTAQVQVREMAFDALTDLSRWRERGRQAARRVWDAGELLFWFTGNHLGAMPLYETFGTAEGDVIVQLDAHLDLYHQGDCTATLSHGNFVRHLEAPRPRIINVGQRDLTLPPGEVAEYFHATLPASRWATEPERCLRLLGQHLRGAKRVLLDLDCDVLDPSVFPAVAYPLPFGLQPGLLLRVIEMIGREQLVGVCVSEFDPARDERDQSLSLLVWLIEWLLLRQYESRTSAAP